MGNKSKMAEINQEKEFVNLLNKSNQGSPDDIKDLIDYLIRCKNSEHALLILQKGI